MAPVLGKNDGLADSVLKGYQVETDVLQGGINVKRIALVGRGSLYGGLLPACTTDSPKRSIRRWMGGRGSNVASKGPHSQDLG